MASSAERETCGSNNNCQLNAITTCTGCNTPFCTTHMNDHRRLLDKEMNNIINKCEQLKNKFKQQVPKLDFSAQIKNIDDWEKQSIEKIKLKAKELRDILQPKTAPIDYLSKELEQLSAKLNKLRQNNNFNDKDINESNQSLKVIENGIEAPPHVCINRRSNKSLIENISISVFKVTTDLFNQMSNKSISFERDGQVAVHNSSDDCTEIRGKTEYEKGCHAIYLRIEELSNSWMLLGINSKSAPLQNDSYQLASTYGWSNDNFIWEKGQNKFNRSKVRIDIKKDDLICLMLDCDNHIIVMFNTRTLTKHELDVDISAGVCPLPWQIQVILCEANSRVRLEHSV